VIYSGHFHWLEGASRTSGSHGFQVSIFLANINSFSACIINSSTCPHPTFFSRTAMSFSYKKGKAIKEDEISTPSKRAKTMFLKGIIEKNGFNLVWPM